MSERSKILACALALATCVGVNARALAQSSAYTLTEVADFDIPWAMEFLPDGRVLVTEQRGVLKLYTPGKGTADISGVPEVAYVGQGGLGDVVLHPQFADNQLVYLSYVEPGAGSTRGAAVARATLVLNERGGGALEDVEVIWRQAPKVGGGGHYGHRILFGPDGYLWISSGERQLFDPAQDMRSNLGKILRLHDDGSVPVDNPFLDEAVDRAGVTAQIWSLGHRNPLGLAFDRSGQLWTVEMGPAGGDELNLVQPGANYGYPLVSNGDHYDGEGIPDHKTRPDLYGPAIFWNPVISPSSLMFYSGSQFPQWQGDAFIGGLSGQAIVRVEIDGDKAREAERIAAGIRVRAVEQGPDGAIWILEDEREGRGGQGRMFKLTAPGAK